MDDPDPTEAELNDPSGGPWLPVGPKSPPSPPASAAHDTMPDAGEEERKMSSNNSGGDDDDSVGDGDGDSDDDSVANAMEARAVRESQPITGLRRFAPTEGIGAAMSELHRLMVKTLPTAVNLVSTEWEDLAKAVCFGGLGVGGAMRLSI